MPLDFISAGAAQALVATVARAAGIEVAGSFGAVGAMLEKFHANAPCDVVILTHAQIAELVEQGALEANTVTDLGASLPGGFDLATVYTAAVNRNAASIEEARRFVERLGDAATAPARAAAGFEGYAIRPARSREDEAIRQVVTAVLGEYGLHYGCDGVDRDLADIQAHYVARGGLFEVVVAPDGRIVGCCGVYPLEGPVCELRKMYLLKEARRQGLGERLLTRALAFARGRGYGRMELETASVLKEAIGLYSKAGFKPAARAHLASRCDQAFALDLAGGTRARG